MARRRGGLPAARPAARGARREGRRPAAAALPGGGRPGLGSPPAASDDVDVTFRSPALLQLEEPTLLLRGPGAGAEWQRRGPAWPAPQLGPFFLALAGDGAPAAHCSPAAPPHLRNFQRALLSLFRFRTADGERNETDVSGACEALYEADGPRAVRKIKVSRAARRARRSAVRSTDGRPLSGAARGPAGRTAPPAAACAA